MPDAATRFSSIDFAPTLRQTVTVNCLVTAGPTYEPLDDVRRLTNFSTGRLGAEFANHLVSGGHQVTLLNGYYAIHKGEIHAQQIETFTTTQDLLERFQKRAGTVEAIFHAAAVSDFTFGTIWSRDDSGNLTAVQEKKVGTRGSTLLAELVPTPKILAQLRDLYPKAVIVGWKYEVDGDRQSVLTRAQRQLTECRTNACVANGSAYGKGFGLVTPDGAVKHCTSPDELFGALTNLVV